MARNHKTDMEAYARASEIHTERLKKRLQELSQQRNRTADQPTDGQLVALTAENLRNIHKIEARVLDTMRILLHLRRLVDPDVTLSREQVEEMASELSGIHLHADCLLRKMLDEVEL